MTLVKITKEEFDAIAWNCEIESETDVNYTYETAVDADGQEMALATYNAFEETTYHKMSAS